MRRRASNMAGSTYVGKNQIWGSGKGRKMTDSSTSSSAAPDSRTPEIYCRMKKPSSGVKSMVAQQRGHQPSVQVQIRICHLHHKQRRDHMESRKSSTCFPCLQAGEADSVIPHSQGQSRQFRQQHPSAGKKADLEESVPGAGPARVAAPS